MLNDLFAIERGLTAGGVALEGRHPDLKDMARGRALGVRLAADGSVDEVEIIPEAGRGKLWTLRDGQHNGFPGLKTGGSLLAIGAEELDGHRRRWDADGSVSARRTELLRLIAESGPDGGLGTMWPSPGHRRRIAERLAEILTLADDPASAAVPAVFERFLRALDAEPPFLAQVSSALASKVRSGDDEWLDLARSAFLGPIPIAVDVAMDDFPRDAGDPRQIAAISLALSRSRAPQPAPAGEHRCALSGASAELHSGKFPQPNLPGLGQSYLFARNRDIPALTRYGRTADASFPIDADLVRRLSGVFDVLTHPDARGRSWRLIPAESGDKSDLLVVSLPALPEEPVADALCDDEENPDTAAAGERRLFELASRIIGNSQGSFAHAEASAEMAVMVLRTVDPANRKAIYHRRLTAAAFFEAAAHWQEAIANLPDWLGLRLPVKGETRLVHRRPARVSPLSITSISRAQYANGGRRRVSVVGASPVLAFGLFLREGDVDRRARRLLRLLVDRHGALLAGLTAAAAKSNDHLKTFDPTTQLRRDALRSMTWLGVLLRHLGRPREVYMSDTAFRLGQLLAAADTIHIGYCADLRGGNVPPNLIGNSVLTIAGRHPDRALAILSSRLKPYLAWAKQEERLRAKIRDMRILEPKTDEQKRAARLSWAISNGLHSAPRLKGLADALRGMDLATADQDRFKAELLLGYVAGLEPQHDRVRFQDSGAEASQTKETSE